MENSNIPFPQANDINKIKKIVNVEDPITLKDSISLGIELCVTTERQVHYYLAATDYLGITKDRKFTELGNKLRNETGLEQDYLLCLSIISKPVFGEVLLYDHFYDVRASIQEIVDIMKQYNMFDGDAMYTRRAQTVRKWVDWVKSPHREKIDFDTEYSLDDELFI